MKCLGQGFPRCPWHHVKGSHPRTARGQGEGQHPGTSTMAGTEASGHSSGHVRRGEGVQTALFAAQLPLSCLKHLGTC